MCFWCGGHEHILVANSVKFGAAIVHAQILGGIFLSQHLFFEAFVGEDKMTCQPCVKCQRGHTLNLASSCQKWWAGSFRRREACCFFPLENQPFGDKPLIVGRIAPVAIFMILGSVYSAGFSGDDSLIEQWEQSLGTGVIFHDPRKQSSRLQNAVLATTFDIALATSQNGAPATIL